MVEEFKIHFNMGRPYLIKNYKNNKYMEVLALYINEDLDFLESEEKYYECFENEDEKKCNEKFYTLLCKIDYKKLYIDKTIGSNPEFADDMDYYGCNCLLEIGQNEYIHIDQNITHFKLPKRDVFEKYVVEMGGSDTPRAYIITNKNYLFIENDYTRCSRKLLDDQGPYDPSEDEEDTPYWRHFEEEDDMVTNKHQILFSSDKPLKFPSPKIIKKLPIVFYGDNFNPEFWKKQNVT